MMKLARLLVISTSLLAGHAHADAELAVFISDVNASASADPYGYRATLTTQFGIPDAEVQLIFNEVDSPADVYMILRVAQVSKKPRDVVITEYKSHKGKGWGVIAKNLGIKPGSKAFHELKKGGPVKEKAEKPAEKVKAKAKGKAKKKGRR